MLFAVEAEPASIRIRRLIWDNASLTRVIPTQPTDERRHVGLSRREECRAGDPEVVHLVTVSGWSANSEYECKQNTAIKRHQQAAQLRLAQAVQARAGLCEERRVQPDVVPNMETRRERVERYPSAGSRASTCRG